MPKEHKVKQGDCLSSIAEEHGLFWEKIWNHSKNTELKEKRKDPNVLYPGDVVFVPDIEQKEESCATEQRHKFRRKGVPEKLQLVLRIEGEPRENVEYIIDIDGNQSRGTTDGEGRVSISIPPGARRGKITLVDAGEEFEVDLGNLDPITEVSGVQARLANLGYDVEVTGQWDERSAEALRQFQSRQELDATGEIDEPTQNKLRDVYGF